MQKLGQKQGDQLLPLPSTSGLADASDVVIDKVAHDLSGGAVESREPAAVQVLLHAGKHLWKQSPKDEQSNRP